MFKQKIFSFVLISGLAVSVFSANLLPASAYGYGNEGEILQSAMNFETQARSSNTTAAWRTAGESWMSQGSMVSLNENHKDWVKDSLNPATHDVSVAILKRAAGCFVKAYELEGPHETPQSRDRSESLRNLLQAYQTLIRVDPRNSDWHYLVGELYCSKGMYKQGTVDLNRAVALGGSGGAKSSALLAHTKPYLAHQLAADHALWAHNEAVDNYNAAHYRPAANNGRMSTGAIYSQLYLQHAHVPGVNY